MARQQKRAIEKLESDQQKELVVRCKKLKNEQVGKDKNLLRWYCYFLIQCRILIG